MGCSPSGTGYSCMGLLQGHTPCQKTCFSMSSSLHGSTGPSSSVLQHGLPTGSQHPSGMNLLWHGVIQGLQVDLYSPVDLHGLQGHNCLPWPSTSAERESQPQGSPYQNFATQTQYSPQAKSLLSISATVHKVIPLYAHDPVLQNSHIGHLPATCISTAVL